MERKSSKRGESVEKAKNSLKTLTVTRETGRHVKGKEKQQMKGESAEKKQQVRAKKEISNKSNPWQAKRTNQRPKSGRSLTVGTQQSFAGRAQAGRVGL